MTARAQTSLLIAVVALASIALPSAARAQSNQADCKITEIAADNSGGGIDPALKPLEKKLKKPPFSAWTTFKQVARHSHTATQMTAVNVSLSTGEKLSLLYRDRIEPKNKNKKLRGRFTFTLDDKKGKRKADGNYTNDSGDYFMLAAQSGENGGHILAVSCVIK